MAKSRARHYCAAPLAALLGVAFCLHATSASAGVEGRAYGAYVNLPAEGVSPITLVDTGELPPGGGALGDSATIANVGKVVRLFSPSSRTESDGCRGSSRSIMAGGSLLPGKTAEVSFGRIDSHDDDECCRHDHARYITSDIANLFFAGIPVVVTGEPNQIVDVPGVGTLVVNEVILMNNRRCQDDDYEVNALDLLLADGGRVVVSSARFNSDDHCCSVPTKTSTWGSFKARYR